MGRASGLCALALLTLHVTLVLGGEVLIFCDDPTVDRAVTSALHKFNERVITGHKLVLFQVTYASKAENGSYWLRFTTRKSNCPASGSTPWTHCHYQPKDKKPINCNATVHMNETDTDTKHVECQIEGLTPSGKAPCMGCPEKIDENSEDLKVPLSVSISKYNGQSNHTHLFTLHAVGPATRQVVAGFRFKFVFDMRRSTCAKAEHAELQDHCIFDLENVEFSNCNSTVDMAPWRQEVPSVHLECGLGQMPPGILRRRPAGWSPLRHVMISFPKPTSATVVTKEAKISGKEESSEEELAKPSPNDSPFHCPSKPWTPAAAADAAPTDAPVEGVFSDLDLLGV